MPIPLEPALTLYLDILKGSKILKPNTVGIAISVVVVSSRAASYRPFFNINHRKMDAIEFNKTLSEAHSISSKLEHRKNAY
jgi:hypothetical protein